MEYQASKTRSLNIAFVVNADLLRRLAVILGETSDKLEYTVTFTDGTSIHYSDIDEVIGQPNSRRASLKPLIFRVPHSLRGLQRVRAVASELPLDCGTSWSWKL
jgi:hypothetical protein